MGLLAATALFAQGTGQISGRVLDASGAAIPGTSIQLLVQGGATPIAVQETNQEGLFQFIGVRPINYDLAVEAKGFQKQILRGIKVDAGLTLSLPPLTLEVSTQAEVVEVTAEVQGVQTSNAEIATSVTNEQVRRLPTLNRSPLGLITTQAGVTSNNRTNTTINGMRPSFTNVTIDGINIQDNFIRTNGLDFLPNLLLMDQVAEMTITTSNTTAADGSGASQIKFVTPSGTNEYHGSLYWYNRNNIASANTWFGNRNRTARPFLNQNQAGGTLGGPVVKDKLFFYGNYELFRLRQQSNATRTILRESARQGILSYRDTAGNVRTINPLTTVGVTADPLMQQFIGQIPGPENINRNDIGDGLNTGGYQFNIQNNRTRDNMTGKVDYVANTKNVFSWTMLWNRDIVDRTDLANDYSTAPKVKNDGAVLGTQGTWRFSPTPGFTNELRGGFNLTPAKFLTDETFGRAIFTLPLVSNPINTFRAQGRQTDTYNFQNNANWFKGKHSISFGLHYQKINTDPFNDAGNIPVYAMGVSAANTRGLTTANVPGLRATDVGIANGLLSLHAGFLTSVAQTFNVTSIDSGFVDGATNLRRYRMNNFAFYVNDTWRVSRKLTMTLGLRWETYTRVTDKDALGLLPRLDGGQTFIQALMSPNSVLDFAGTVVNRPFYGNDLNNLGPNVGIAYQPFGDNKTVIRAGFSTQFPNDDFIQTIRNNVNTNSGLGQNVTVANLVSVASNPTAVPVPAFRVPRTFADNYAVDTQTAFGMPDPNLRTPYVMQWNFGIQREIARGVLDVRYVGNRAVKQWRAFDYNQVLVRENELPGYFSDFMRAYNNGLRSLAANNTFLPAYNPNIPGSQPLPFFAQLPSGGLLTNATIIGNIQRGEVGNLASTYQINRLNGPFSFFNNRNALGTNSVSNYSSAAYHGLQMDYRRTFRGGLQLQANYTYSKVMSDASGDGQTRFEPFLDMQNPGIERGRVPFDLTHAFKMNGVWDLPFGKGMKFDIANPILNQMFGGWSVSGFMTLQSGNPFSITAPRGTLNRTARSANNTAFVLTGKAQLDDVLSFRMTPDGPYFVSASAIGPDGRGVAPDGRAPFDGQVFYNPAPGMIAGLQRNYFSGPRFYNTDLAILKTFPITEGQRLEFRSEWFNLTNTPSFYFNGGDINSATFGRITATASGRRIIQFGLYYKF
jgi:hypothetical protein